LESRSFYTKKYTDNYSGTPTQVKIALEAAKEFVKKYSDDEYVKEIVDYLKKIIPVLEETIEKYDDVTKNFNNFPRRH